MDALFQFDTVYEHDPAIDDWLNSRAPEFVPIVTKWFGVIRECGNDVREIMHDGYPTACVQDAAFAYINAFTAHVNLGFFRGAEIDDPDGLLQGSGKYMRHVKLRPGEDIDEDALRALILVAYADMRTRL